MVNGINVYTRRLYDLNGKDMNGIIPDDVDWDYLEGLKSQIYFEKRKYIEDIIQECDWYDSLIESYNEDTEEFEEYFGELNLFISIVQATGIKENEEQYTEEEVLEYMIADAQRRNRRKYYQELRDYYMNNEFVRMKMDGDLLPSDIEDAYRLY